MPSFDMISSVSAEGREFDALADSMFTSLLRMTMYLSISESGSSSSKLYSAPLGMLSDTRPSRSAADTAVAQR